MTSASFAQYRELMNAVAGEDWQEWKPGRVKFRCCFTERHRNGDANWSGHAMIGQDPNGLGLMLKCSACGARTTEYAAAKGIPFKQFLPKIEGGSVSRRSMSQPKPELVATYNYRNEAGEIIASKLRYEPGWYGDKKSFAWRRPIPKAAMEAAGATDHTGYTQGKGALSAGLFAPTGQRVNGMWPFEAVAQRDRDYVVELPDVELTLYQLPELIAAPPTRVVFIVEGEKCVGTLNRLGFVATCPPCGKSLWQNEWAAYFSGRLVVVIPDHHHPGVLHGDHVVGSVLGAGAAAVRYLMPNRFGYEPPEHGGDITDWLKRLPEQVWKRALLDLLSRVPAYRSTATTQAA